MNIVVLLPFFRKLGPRMLRLDHSAALADEGIGSPSRVISFFKRSGLFFLSGEAMSRRKMIQLRFFRLSGFDTLNRESGQISFSTIKRVEV